MSLKQQILYNLKKFDSNISVSAVYRRMREDNLDMISAICMKDHRGMTRKFVEYKEKKKNKELIVDLMKVYKCVCGWSDRLYKSNYKLNGGILYLCPNCGIKLVKFAWQEH